MAEHAADRTPDRTRRLLSRASWDETAAMSLVRRHTVAGLDAAASYIRDKTGHALIGARQWIPAEDLKDPITSLITGLPLDLRFRTKGQPAIDVLDGAHADAVRFDFVCGEVVYGNGTELRQFLEDRGQLYVLRVASSFMLMLADGARMTCADAVRTLLKDTDRRWDARCAAPGSKGERRYAWAWIATHLPRHYRWFAAT